MYYPRSEFDDVRHVGRPLVVVLRSNKTKQTDFISDASESKFNIARFYPPNCVYHL